MNVEDGNQRLLELRRLHERPQGFMEGIGRNHRVAGQPVAFEQRRGDGDLERDVAHTGAVVDEVGEGYGLDCHSVASFGVACFQYPASKQE